MDKKILEIRAECEIPPKSNIPSINIIMSPILSYINMNKG